MGTAQLINLRLYNPLCQSDIRREAPELTTQPSSYILEKITNRFVEFGKRMRTRGGNKLQQETYKNQTADSEQE